MTSPKENGSYSVPNTDTALFKQFYGNRANQEETAQTIHDVFTNEQYLLDPHTAVADAVYTKYKKETETKLLQWSYRQRVHINSH